MSWAIAICKQSGARLFKYRTCPGRQQGRITIVVGDKDIHLEGIFEEDTVSWTGKLGDLILLPVRGAQIAVLLDCDEIFVMDEVCVETVSWAKEMGLWRLELPAVVTRAIEKGYEF